MAHHSSMTHPQVNDFDVAARWALEQPHLQQLMHDCYVTHDTLDNARRFFHSDEFSETLVQLTRMGFGPDTRAKVLDFGCGNGIASYAFSRAGFEVTATDLCTGDVAGLGAARRLIGKDGVKFEILEGNLLNFPAKPSFDVIYCRQVLHHLKPLNGIILDHLSKLLRPGGVFCAMREQVIWSENQRNRLIQEHPLNHITQDENGFYLNDYRKAFAETGLVLKKTLWPYESAINILENELEQLRQWVFSRLPMVGSFIWKQKLSRVLLLRSIAIFWRSQPAYQVFSFLAVKPPIHSKTNSFVK